MLNQTAAEANTCADVNSTGAFAGARLIKGTEAAIAAPAVAQKGQKCELPSEEVRSAQKWNCTARKTSPSRRAQICSFFESGSKMMLLVGRKMLPQVHRGMKQRSPPVRGTQGGTRLPGRRADLLFLCQIGFGFLQFGAIAGGTDFRELRVEILSQRGVTRGLRGTSTTEQGIEAIGSVL